MKNCIIVFIGIALLLLPVIPSAGQPKYASLNEIDQEFRASRVEAEKRIAKFLKKNPNTARSFTAKQVEYALVDVSPSGIPHYIKTDNAEVAASLNVPALYFGGALGMSLDGFAIEIGIWDGGKVKTFHQDLTGKVTQMDDPYSLSDHATHTTGTMVASGLDPRARGMAINATVKAYDFDNDVSEMTSQAKPDRYSLLLSNHSYGTVAGWGQNKFGTGMVWYGDPTVSNIEDYKFGFYDVQAAQWDAIAYNAPYYLIVKSAGNDRGESGPGPQPPDGSASGYDCIATYGGAKNILTVGASYKLTNYSLPSDVVMTPFSGWGPTDDGRIKPDLVAPGMNVYSTVAFNANYASYSGTSMSAAAVTGTLALLQQMYERLHSVPITGSSPMKSATLKALVLHTAREAGPNPGPDYMFGWGLLDAEAAGKVILQEDSTHFISEQSLTSGEIFVLPVHPKPGTKLTATIVWTDPAGTSPTPSLDPVTKMLINDLDIRLKDAGGNIVQMPWRLNPLAPNAAATHGDNFRDNVEKIELDNLTDQTYSIAVSHKNTLVGGAQAFSLILTYTPQTDLPTTYYWVGDDGAWDDPVHWSLSSGGPSAMAIPGIDDNVLFDENSFPDENGIVTTQSDLSFNSIRFLSRASVDFSFNGKSVTVADDLNFLSGNRLTTSTAADIRLIGSRPRPHLIRLSAGLSKWKLTFDGNASWKMTDFAYIDEMLIRRGTVNLYYATLNVNRISGTGTADKNLGMSFSSITGITQLSVDFSELPIADGQTYTVINADPAMSNTLNFADREFHGSVYVRNGTVSIDGTNYVEGFGGNGTVSLSGSLEIGGINLSGGSTLILAEGSTQRFSSYLTFPTSATQRVKIKSNGTEQAVIQIDDHAKICMDYVDIVNVAIQGNSLVNAGAHSTLVNSPNWLQTNCTDLIFPDFTVQYPCVDAMTYFINSSIGPINSCEWDFGDGILRSRSRPDNQYQKFEAPEGERTVTLTANGIDQSRSLTKTFTLLPNALPENFIEYSKNKMTSHVVSGMGYQWFQDGYPLPSAVDRILNYDITEGVYQVVIFDETCNRISEPFIITEIPDDNTLSTSLKVYPNPSSDQFIFETEIIVSGVQVLDAVGRSFPVKTELMDHGKYRVSLSFLVTGLYILKVTDGQKVEWKKILVSK